MALLGVGEADVAPTFASVLGEATVRGTVERVTGEVREDLRKRKTDLEVKTGFTEAIVGRILPLKVTSTDKIAVTERLKIGFGLFLRTLVQERIPTAGRR